jgi:hypothetical protein
MDLYNRDVFELERFDQDVTIFLRLGINLRMGTNS